MVISRTAEFFRDLLLRYRGRSGLTQRDLAERVGVNRRSVQEWENGGNYPGADRLEALVRVLLEGHGLTPGQEAAEAQALWAAVQREAPHTHAPFDQTWFAQLLAARATPAAASVGTRATSPGEAIRGVAEGSPAERREDWGEAPDAAGFIGRTDELLTLSSWIMDARCRLVGITGMGGIGKTSLAAKLAQAVAPSFERVYWRSLRDAPPVSDWLAGAISFLSDQQLVPPAAYSERVTALLRLLRERPCLLVLDNFETLFEPEQGEVRYREGLAGYGRLLQSVGESAHQSCFVLTSREAPTELAVLSGDAVRSLPLGGLAVEAAQVLLAAKELVGSSQEWVELTGRCGGNALALKLAGERIRELFVSDIRSFLDEAGTVFSGIRRLLAEQLKRTSALEQDLLRVLAVAREPVSLAELVAAVGPDVARGAVLEALEALRRRSLVERAETPGRPAFTLQSVVLEYATYRLVEVAADEIGSGQPEQLLKLPLIQARARDYVRQSQERLIGTPILQKLTAHHGEEKTAQLLLGLLDGWRDRPAPEQGYGPGNVVNLLRLLRGHLSGLDLSHLAIRQAYLAGTDMQDSSLEDALITEATFSEAFDHPTSVALSADGGHLAVGTATGQLYLWRLPNRLLVLSLQAHTSGVHGLALTTDGRLMASGSEDATVKLWDTETGQLRATMRGHTGSIPDVALSADGRVVVSAGMDTTVRLWDAATGEALAVLRGHSDVVRGVASSGNGLLVASVSDDGSMRLWTGDSGQTLLTVDAHSGPARGVALSWEGQLAASAGDDGTVKVWDVPTGRLLWTLEAHAGPVYRVALSSDGGLIAGATQDRTVVLWESTGGRRVLSLEGRSAGVRSVALSGDGRLISSSSHDGTVTLWEVPHGTVMGVLEGYTAGLRSVALADNGRLGPEWGETVSGPGPRNAAGKG